MAKRLNKTWSTPVTFEEKQLVPCMLCASLSFKPSLVCEGFSYVRCSVCGLVQMNPQPLEAEIIRRYGEGSGKDYLSYQLQNEKAFLDLQLLALRDVNFDSLEKELLSNRDEPARVLDIGCATGNLLVDLRKKGWETVGIEISSPQVEYGTSSRKLDIRSVPLEENQFPDAYFSVVLASHLIEHLNNPAALCAEVHRILAPGGHFFVTTPNIAGFQARLFKNFWRSAIFDHLYLFSIKTLKRLLKEKGFVIEKTATWGGLAEGTAPAPVKRFFDKAAKRLCLGDVMIIKARKV